jgi:formate dehydrogenase beta subunit
LPGVIATILPSRGPPNRASIPASYSSATGHPVPLPASRRSPLHSFSRSLIVDLLQIQNRDGWLAEQALHDLATQRGVPLHVLEGLTSFYTYFRRQPPRPTEIEVCRDLSCQLAGGREACQRLRSALEGRDDVAIHEVSCLGRCDRAPAGAIARAGAGEGEGESESESESESVVVDMGNTEAVLSALEHGATARAHSPGNWQAADPYSDPVMAPYATLRCALQGDPADLPPVLEDAGLRGMGGAAFPTGRKWSLVAAAPAGPRHVIANADESEPGAFKDREILRDLPHLLIEGMILAGFAIGARHGTIFIRHEYEAERQAVEAALARARKVGALGAAVFGSPFDFEIDVFVSPGGYILGEETALLECLEDRRGEPRNKPPFPGVSGLFGQPTLINNVETFAHATSILHHGADWWRGLGRPGFSGHKFMSVSGDVEQAGVHLVPFGTPLGELLERCGGIRAGQELLAVAPGGASSRFLGAEALEVAIDFQTISEAGSMLGAGAVVFVSDRQNLLEVGLSVTRFFRNESCGKCVPCRVGTEKAVQWVEAKGAIGDEERERLAELHSTLSRTSICGLGQIALEPLLSLAERFPQQMRGD